MSDVIDRAGIALEKALGETVTDPASLVRAVLMAIRDPTEEMCRAGARYFHDNYREDHAKEDTSMALIWQEMIDEALS